MVISYTNPVYTGYLGDPFVLVHEGQYYACGTGPGGPTGEQFPVLQSTDLVHWQPKGWALAPAPGIEFWAPEVTYQDGTFYLYYSARGIEGLNHQLRVATSSLPLGPFVDSGRMLVKDDPFTIDPHPFRDDDGQWYLFYARDFLTLDENYRVGTGIVVDRLVDQQTLAGNPQLVIRPHADWQLFLANRPMYGSVYDWYTIEGPSVLKHDGLYYCFYSGGSWERENYGIAYTVADQPLGPYRRPADLTGPILQSVPGHVIGPGHNSFTCSPEENQVVVYHGWDAAATTRMMRIDRLTWDGDRPVIHGPTWTPQTLD